MAWNGLGSGKDGSLERLQHKSCGRSGGRRRGRRAALVCLPVAALAIAACICIALFRGEKRTLEPEAQGKSHLIADVGTNAVAKLPATESAPVKWPEKNPNRKDGIWRHGEGPRSVAVTNGCLVTYPNCPGVQLILPHPSFAAPFENISDNELARLLTARPGDDFIDAPLPKDFDARFAESLLSPIRITEDDSPEKAEMKRLVIEARKTLAEAVKRGESPRQILDEEAKNMRRLMQIRDNYQRIVDEQIAECASESEISELVSAANKVLEKEGVESRVMPPGWMRLRVTLEKRQMERNWKEGGAK